MAIEIPEPLIDEISKGRASLFLGAGSSVEAGFPDSQNLAVNLLKRVGDRLSNKLAGMDLSDIADYLYDEPGYGKGWVRAEIIRYFLDIQNRAIQSPCNAHDTITKIKWSTIFTTNFDRSLELTYELSPNRVQRPLLFYYPDMAMFRNDEGVIRIIKLNGSIDEAERNQDHELVLTFADQQQARIRNEQFYNLLRQEASKGPIIFIGFRFIHPGTSKFGTSPEFLVIQDLLREISPTARWHYLIMPFKGDSIEEEVIERKLKSNKIKLINATFGEFVKTLYGRLDEPSIPLNIRPPIIVPVGSSSVKIEDEDYSKNRRHFEIIGEHLNKHAPSVAESLNGYELWSSFFQEHFIERSCKKELLRELDSRIENSQDIVTVVASAGWGKTFLLKDVSVQFYREGRPVIWLNPFSTIETGSEEFPVIIGKWDIKSIDRIISIINEKAKEQGLSRGEGIPVIISDNIPERIEETLSLFRYLTNNGRSFLLVIAVRDNEFESICQKHPLIRQRGIFRPEGIYDSAEEVSRLVDFCAHNHVGSIENENQKELITSKIIQSEADRALILALQIIFDKNHRPFSEIVKDFWKNIPTENAKTMVLRVSSMHRFGSSFYPRINSLLNTFPEQDRYQVLENYENCLKNGTLFEDDIQGEPCVRTLHSLVSELITKICGKTNEEIDENLLCLIQEMTNYNERDLEIIRHFLKQVNDYNITLSSEEMIAKIFQVAAMCTNDDWVVCHQFSSYLLKRNEFELANVWIEKAMNKNPNYPSLQHTKANILRHWGRALKIEGNIRDSAAKISEARKYFTLSRLGSEPNEYGYVTPLDMLRNLINDTDDEIERSNLIAEGTQLYKEGIDTVPDDRFNILLDERFKIFDPDERSVQVLCEKIEKAFENGRATNSAVSFLAEYIYKSDNYDRAIEILEEQELNSEEGILIFLKEAELHAKMGNFYKASKSLDSAKRRESKEENAEIRRNLWYWDLIVSVILRNFREARKAAKNLAEITYYSRRNLPKGYIWKEDARNVPQTKRSFKDHAIIWSGKIQDRRAEGRYGRIELANSLGDTFNISFNPKDFQSQDLRRGDHLYFIISLRQNGLQAENPNLRPFVGTKEDIYVP